MAIGLIGGGVVGAVVGAGLTLLANAGRHRPCGAPAGPSDDAMVRAGLDALQAGVLVLDPQDGPVFVNPAAREMGLAWMRPDGRLEVHTIIRNLVGQARRDGSTRMLELDLPRTTAVAGGLEPRGVHVRAVAFDGGHVAVEAADVTESHRLARVRRDFVANVSHELKTPVGALQLLAEALLEATATEPVPAAAGPPMRSDGTDAGGDPVAARRFAERIRHESTRLGRLIAELLELSRLQGAEPLPEPEPVSLDRVVAEVVDRARTPASVKAITIGWVGMRGLTVYGNESQLVTAVANLVENAVAYSGEATEVTISTAGDDQIVEIAVTDQGIGIEPKHIDRIFERFYRADRARSRATGGTGLGLAIVKHIATNHGGRVDVVSAVGTGSTFTLRLPARPLDALPALPGSIEINDDAGGPITLADPAHPTKAVLP